jgi:predicted GIY-YIG superfamily endonuclease
LHLPDDPRGRTYVGYTVDPLRRLRQHNGELRGGARATARATRGHTGGAWRHLFVIVVERADGDFGAHEALSLEWHLKRGRGGGGGGARAKKASRCNNRGVARRLELLREALCLPKFERFRGRIAVFVDNAHIDSAFAVLVDAAGPPCCVMPLGTLFDDAYNYTLSH